MKTLKIVIYDFKRIIIEGYNNLYDIDDSVIKVDSLVIKGDNIKISSLDSFCIEVVGTIASLGVDNG